MIVALVVVGLLPHANAVVSTVAITTLSNRADLVSGGDVLIEVSVPQGETLRSFTTGVHEVGEVFVRTDAGHLRGLLTGLPLGRTTLTARTTSGQSASLVVTNHPSTGPIFAGEQVQPWTCNTAPHGLGPPQDKACTTPSIVTWQYKSAVTGRFDTYDPAHPPPAPSIASTTTDQGVRAPYVVKVEKGVMDRGLYTIAVLADPANTWTALYPQPTWNHKLASPFGGSCNPRHQQEAVDTGINEMQPTLFSVLDDAKLSKGFMVAHNGLDNLGSDCNDVVAAEALMMLKEHIVEQYGTIRYTIGFGCSGGSMLQHLIAADYPGLLDGILPACSFPDMWSTVTEAEDCHLLWRVFAADPTWTPTQQAAVAGYQTLATCGAFEKLPVNNTQSWFDPTYAAGCGTGFKVYDPKTNPRGMRCDLQDYAVAQLGRRPDGFGNRPFDNIGVQYGMRALESGAITAEQFVRLNEQIGGDDIDWKPTTSRVHGDLNGVRNAYLGGRILDGRLLADVPILDLRGTSNQEIHTDYHSYAVRARLDQANGTHANQVIWTSVPMSVDPVSYAASFFVMDSWLASIEKDHRPISKARKVALDKPAVAVDSCFVAGHQITDLSVCAAAFPHYGDPRLAAGGPINGGVLACTLRPATRLPGLSDTQWQRLRKAFPSGVCDPRRPGRGQVPATPWATYASGAPVALGPAPVSS